MNLLFFLTSLLTTSAFILPPIKSRNQLILKQGIMEQYFDFNETGIPTPPNPPPQSGVRIIFKPGDEGVREEGHVVHG